MNIINSTNNNNTINNISVLQQQQANSYINENDAFPSLLPVQHGDQVYNFENISHDNLWVLQHVAKDFVPLNRQTSKKHRQLLCNNSKRGFPMFTESRKGILYMELLDAHSGIAVFNATITKCKKRKNICGLLYNTFAIACPNPNGKSRVARKMFKIRVFLDTFEYFVTSEFSLSTRKNKEIKK